MSKRVARLRCYRYGARPGERDVYRAATTPFLRATSRVADLTAVVGLADSNAADGTVERHTVVDRTAARWLLDDGSVDLVLADDALGTVDDPARLLQEVARVLRPGGVALAWTSNRSHPPAIVAGWLAADTGPRGGRSFGRHTLAALASSNGLALETTSCRQVQPSLALDHSVLGYRFCAAWHEAIHFLHLERWLGATRISVFRKPAA